MLAVDDDLDDGKIICDYQLNGLNFVEEYRWDGADEISNKFLLTGVVFLINADKSIGCLSNTHLFNGLQVGANQINIDNVFICVIIPVNGIIISWSFQAHANT